MSRTVVVTPFGRADQLAAACVLNDIDGDVVPIGDFSAIVFSHTDVHSGNAAAATISKLAGKNEVLLMVRTDEQIDAGHYRNGVRESDVPAGLALTNLPPELEKLLLETIDPADIDGHIAAGSLSKLQASAATMTPQRAALARTALLWIFVAVLAVVAAGVSLIPAIQGSVLAWVICGLAVIAAVIAVLRTRRLLTGARSS